MSSIVVVFVVFALIAIGAIGMAVSLLSEDRKRQQPDPVEGAAKDMKKPA